MNAFQLGGQSSILARLVRRFLFVSGIIFAGICVILALQSATATAAPAEDDVPTWVNETTIRVGDSEFSRTRNGGGGQWTFTYTEQLLSGSCTSTLSFDSDPYGNSGGQSARRNYRVPNSSTAGCVSALANGSNRVFVANASAVNANQEDGSPTNIESGTPEDGDACANTGSFFAFFACPFIDGAFVFIEGINNTINTLMTVDTNPIFYTDQATATDDDLRTSNAFYAAWSSFRAIALGIVVIAALIIIVSTAFGFEFLDAYTIRKALPRVLLAVIFIALSWEVMEFLVTLSNDLGNGIRALIYAPFSNFQQVQIGWDESGIFILLTVIGYQAIGVLGILSFALTAGLAVIVAFLVLILREMIIILLVILAPIAIACLILPNTQKFWQFWQNTLTAMLLAFPIIAALIATGRVFSAVAYQGNEGNLINTLIAFIAYFLPYFLLPLTFRLAGGLLARLGAVANDSERGAFDRLKKFRGAQGAKRWGQGGYKRDPIERRVLQNRGAMAASLQSLGSSQKATPLGRVAARAGAKMVGGYNVEAAISAKRAQVQKEMKDQISTGEDKEIRALTAIGDVQTDDETKERYYKTVSGARVPEAAVKAARARWGNDTFAQQTALSYEMTKATTEEEKQSIADNYGTLSRDVWKNNAYQRDGTWIGAAYENQNSSLEYKSMKYNEATGSMAHTDLKSQGKLINEIYEKRGSYNVSQMGSNTIETLRKANNRAIQAEKFASTTEERQLATQQKERIAAIAETFVHDLGMGGGGVIPTGSGGDVEPVGPTGGGSLTGKRVSGTQGSAHVAERVRQLAEDTGVLSKGPTGSYTHDPFNAREQK